MTTPEQLPLPLPVRTARGREDYFVSDSNALAVSQIDHWQTWQPRKFVLTGPPASGKTHLANVWATASGARIIDADTLIEADIPSLAHHNLCVEAPDAQCGDDEFERALFHLHNLILANGHALLLTARMPVRDWPIALPDLKSRMMGTLSARLEDPDDTLLSALLLKLFADRQITPAPDVIPYLATHMPRSYAAAHEIVTRLDTAAMARASGVTRPLAKSVLTKLADTDDPAHL
ncbi:chromosomal replication initiator DnaA [Cognatishimia sp. F0-27]|uniref:chromosomal replication initiator DnaA n=1 Tax=Cognatishimia sp. F0-27 TaxID=2816855 RepID=UPI001D0C6C7F|nr:chromosomal replication initiator DnaA [Cognatishimia sp. F0-27]MCC1493295.1 chromosomal replication initiator DnaA [Cognatishimia sp. F0-27]